VRGRGYRFAIPRSDNTPAPPPAAA
jgi:hypothetical protein